MDRIREGAPGQDPPAAHRPLAEAVAKRRLVALAGHEGRAQVARSHLHDRDAVVRATALRALARCRDLRASEIMAAADDPEAPVRRAAAEVLATWKAGHTGREDVPVSLLGLLGDEDTSVIEMAAWAAGERLPPEAGVVERLAELATSHPDALVREAAVASLGSIGDPLGLPAILRATHDRATVRRRAVLALAPFDGPEVDRALERARSDRDWQVRQAAEDLLNP
ncbi:MAG: HEAT repeat domain-containing protein [Acidimicrobiales bacterium]